MDKKITVFLSSRFSEFRELRDKMITQKFSNLNLILELIALDDSEDTADSRSPLVASLEEAESSDIFVLLLGETYGSVPPSHLLSYTHLEYEKALQKDLKILAFAIGDSYSEPITFSEDKKFAELQKAVCINNRHRTKIRPSIKNEEDIEDIYKDILKAVTKELINTHKGNVSNQKKNHQLSKKSGQNKIVGRGKELQEIEQGLMESSCLSVQGIGGVGKSTLASYYLYIQKRNFDYYGFFDSVDSFYIELISAFKLDLDADILDVLREVRSLEGDVLFVIDDVQKEDDIEGILGLGNCQILLTSRYQLGCKTYDLNTLTSKEAEELFLLYHKTEDLKSVQIICSYLDNHTFFVELIAKTIETQGYSLQEIIEKFNNGELTKIEFIDNQDGHKSSFSENLRQLFSLQKLTKKRNVLSYAKEKFFILFRKSILDEDDYILLLKRLSVLPSIEIEYYFLEEIFSDKELKGKLNFLVYNGWLIQNGNRFKLHQIIKEYIWVEHLFNFKEIEKIIFYFLECIKNSIDPIVANTNKNNLSFFNSVLITLEKINKIDYNLADFSNNIGLTYYSLGKYKDAEIFYLKALNIQEELQGIEDYRMEFSYSFFDGISWTVRDEIHPYLDITYNHLGILYHELCEYNKAETMYKKALKIKKELVGENHISLSVFYINLIALYKSMGDKYNLELIMNEASEIRSIELKENESYIPTVYNNVALLYESLGISNKIEFFYKKALKDNKELLGDNHFHTVTYYINLATYYNSIGAYKKAKPLYLKALQLRKSSLGRNHLLTADICFRLGVFYANQNKNTRAVFFHRISLDIREELLDSINTDMASSYSHLYLLYLKMNDLKTSYTYAKKALNIKKELLPPNHPDILDLEVGIKDLEKKLNIISDD